MLDPTTFRNALARFASGVTIVTTLDSSDRAAGFTASAFSSLSLDPPLVLVCLDKRADCYATFYSSNHFAVNVLASDQAEIAKKFATKGIDKFFDTAVERGDCLGLPLINGSIVQLECRVYDKIEAGDHTIFVGLVVSAIVDDGEPLVYYDRKFGRFIHFDT